MRHHFIREHVENNDICLEYVKIEDQIADIFTKPLSTESFYKIRKEMGMIDIDALMYRLGRTEVDFASLIKSKSTKSIPLTK